MDAAAVHMYHIKQCKCGCESGTQSSSHYSPVNLCLCVVRLVVFASGCKKSCALANGA